MIAVRLVPAALALLALTACWTPTSPDASFGKPFDLKVGAIATLSDGLRIRFDKVTADSRCPLDVQCIRAGEAIIAVSLVTSKGSPETREMRTDATGAQITYRDHTVQLTALAPHPRASQQTDPKSYVATFVVQNP